VNDPASTLRSVSGPPRLTAYAVAVAAVLAAAGMRWLLNPLIGLEFPFATFFGAVVCAAWFGGFGPGMLAVVLSCLVAEFLFITPRFTFYFTRDSLVGGTLFAVVSTGCVMLSGSLHRARARALSAEAKTREMLLKNSRLYDEAQLELAERRSIEAALRASEGRFRTLVTATGAMVWRMAPDGRIIEEPAGWEQVTGQTYAELKDNPQGWFSRVHPADLTRLRTHWDQVQAAKRMVDVEFRLQRKDGSYRRMQTVGVPLLDPDGSIREWIGTTIDVHDQREAEEQLHQAQRMETIGRLAGGMAHETNNQMMVILSLTEFLLQSTSLTESERSDLGQLGEAAERVAQLTRQLLALSRRQVLDPRVLDLDGVVQEAEAVLRRTLGPEINLTAKFDPGNKWVLADRTQLIQVLVNLALNARDAISGKGELTISTRRAERGPLGGRLGTVWHDWGVALLSVADSGSGMEPPVLNRIFEPFFSTKPMGQGTGLGLSVVEGIVSQSGGDIWVESKPGYGTVVTIGLPLTEAPASPEAKAGGVARSGGTETILVVDDEDQVRRLLVRGLRSGRYGVLEASGPEEAIALLEQDGTIALLVTDIAMPNMSGAELALRVAALWPDLPVIFVSGHPYEVVARDREMIAQGRFLQKPFKVDDLLSMVRMTLDESPRTPGIQRPA
jgi:two-component system, cell cycle sensor histidine kinase and response regulator CckA